MTSSRTALAYRLASVVCSKVIQQGVVLTLFAAGIAGVVSMILEIARVGLLDEIGSGDSYILHDVIHFARTGIIYRDLSQPPYVPSLYSPMVYAIFAAAYKSVGLANPFIGPRLVVIAAVVGCIATAISIARALNPGRRAGLFALLITSSLLTTRHWMLQIRGDFLGILLSLLAIRFLLSDERRYMALFAGVCARLALQFKITFVSAGVAGVVWLAMRRRWTDLLQFAGVAALAAAAPYVWFAMRESQMVPQMLTLTRGVPDVKGAFGIIREAASEPVVALALLGLPLVIDQADRRWRLLLLFWLLSFVVAGVTAVQAGANINYYFELIFGLVAVAVAGLTFLFRVSRRFAGVGLFTAFLAANYVVWPQLKAFPESLVAAVAVPKSNEQMMQLESLLSPYHTLSTIPRLALIDHEPTLTEPFLLSYLLRVGRIDQTPILASVRARQFDAVLTSKTPMVYRGILAINEGLGLAIDDNYLPYCAVRDIIVRLPMSSINDQLVTDLMRLGCQRVTP